MKPLLEDNIGYHLCIRGMSDKGNKMKNYKIIDIETEAYSAERLGPLLPEFNEADVKVGNIKDEAKIQAKIIEAKENHLANFLDKAALSAQTSRILVIGVLTPDGVKYIEGKEEDMLVEFWELVNADTDFLVGHNIKLFDMPFLFRRSFIHGIKPALGIFDGRYWSERIIDTMDRWQFGRKDSEQGSSSLDRISKCLGLAGKLGNGKDFAKLYHSDKVAAMAYLLRDLEMTQAVAKRMYIL